MPKHPKSVARTRASLLEEVAELHARLSEAEDTLEAIRTGSVDALVVRGEAGEQVFTLAGAEHRYRVIIETMSEAAVTLGLDGTILFANPSTSRMLNVPSGELVGKSLEAYLFPTDSKAFGALLRKAKIAPVRTRLVLCSPAGAHIPVYATANVLLEGDSQSICVVMTDMTQIEASAHQLRLAEQQFRRIVETANEGILTFDAAGRITFANARMAEMLGYEAGDLASGSLDDFTDRAWAAIGRERSIECRQGAQQRFDYKCLHKSGEDVWGIVSSSPIVDEKGAFAGMLWMVVDVTDRRRLEMEVLGAADAERRRIGQDLHDTLGQSFAALTLLSRLLAQNLASRGAPEADEALTIAGVAKEGAEASRRMSHGLAPREVTPEGLCEAVANLTDDTSRLFGVKCGFAPGKPVRVSDAITAGHAYLIVREAVNNAIKHAKARSIVVDLGLEEDHAVLRVTDDGVGLPADIPAGQAGKGIGLRVMQYRADIIGATLSIGPGPSGGTVVSCRIPVGDYDEGAEGDIR